MHSCAICFSKLLQFTYDWSNMRPDFKYKLNIQEINKNGYLCTDFYLAGKVRQKMASQNLLVIVI